MRFRKRPIEIEAIRFNGLNEHSLDFGLPEDGVAPPWLPRAYAKGDIEASRVDPLRGAWVHTKHGPVLMRAGDWLIRDPEGDLHPCDPETFHRTYEAIQ